MSAESNKQVIRDLVANGWGKRDLAVFQRIFADAFVDRTPPFGADGSKGSFLGAIQGIHAAFPDLELTLEDMVAEGDKVAWRWTFKGHQTWDFMGMPASGKAVSFDGLNIDRIVNGQIVERWARMDAMSLMAQLGMSPPPGK